MIRPIFETILIEIPDREGPYGGKEAGQGPLNPTIPAIANAVYNALGVHIDEVPITPEKVLKALKAETTTLTRVARPQVPPIEAPAPWPTRLIKWQPEGMDGARPGQRNGHGSQARVQGAEMPGTSVTGKGGLA